MWSIKFKKFEEAGEGSEGSEGSAAVSTESGTALWTDELSDDHKGIVGVKGWAGASDVIDSYHNLEKMAGNPASMVMMPGEGSTEADINAYHTKLGRPENAAGYNIPISESNGNADLAAAMGDIFFQAGISGDQATMIAEKFNEFTNGQNNTQAQNYDADIGIQNEALQNKWGEKYDFNVGVAGRAAAEFGLQDADIDGMEQALGFSRTMELLNEIGSSLLEDTYEGHATDNRGFSVLTPAEARVKIAEMKVDSKFQERYLNGEGTALAEMERLQKLSIGRG